MLGHRRAAHVDRIVVVALRSDLAVCRAVFDADDSAAAEDRHCCMDGCWDMNVNGDPAGATMGATTFVGWTNAPRQLFESIFDFCGWLRLVLLQAKIYREAANDETSYLLP